jgi:hypothetical protein
MSWLSKVRWQFSLLSLMGCMLIVALSAALYGAHLRAVERQEQAFRELSRKGFSIAVYGDGTYLYTGGGGPMCGTGISRYMERRADNIFASEDVDLLDAVILLRSIDVTGLRLPEQRVEELRKRFPLTRIENGRERRREGK